MKKNIFIGSLAIMGVVGASIWGFAQLDDNNTQYTTSTDQVTQTAVTQNTPSISGQVDFTNASEMGVKSVVHITTRKEVNALTFYGYQTVPQTGSGSGVIISADGYIVTNHHVVEGVNEVKVTFSNNKSTTARVIGTDPSTDLAVLKVDGSGYPFLAFGNSDDVVLGQWVLAVGYPFNLDVTVTAGIVSAKSRNLGINNRQSKYAIESFIQTDAAVNMGNSGGALINTSGHLIGINSAIATPTGTYAGYSYAIPSNLVRKVVEDIISYGEVKRGFVGASFVDLNLLDEKTSEKFGVEKSDFDNASGILVTDVLSSSGADDAGLQKGDIITKLNGKELKNASQMMELIAMRHPGDKIDFEYIRKGSVRNANVTLKTREHTTPQLAQSSKKSGVNSWFDDSDNDTKDNADWGLDLEDLSDDFKEKYGLNDGVLVSSIKKNSTLRQFTNIKDGFLITKINGQTVRSADQAKSLLAQSKSIRIEGTYPGTNSYQTFSFSSGGR